MLKLLVRKREAGRGTATSTASAPDPVKAKEIGESETPEALPEKVKEPPNEETSAKRKSPDKKAPWTAEEHAIFLRGLEEGRPRKKIAAMIGTKSAAQVRCHAQRHFKKQKAIEKKQKKEEEERQAGNSSEQPTIPSTPITAASPKELKRKPEEEPGRLCAGCQNEKPIHCFSKRQRGKGADGRCKECVAST